ncbi:MAG: fibronectin type III domain-containing protein, partial [Bacteroidales bacterium]|nr:fibronectin type III domain-containing protein [Bacteroidales bacterium]
MKTKQILFTLLLTFLVPLAVNAQNIYTENFDSYTVGSGTVTPTGWTVTTSGTGVYATVFNANAYSTPNCFLMGNPAALTANRSVVAVLPTFDLLNLNCTKLTFRVKSSSASMGNNTLSVGYTYSDLSGDHTQVLHTCEASTSYTEVTLSFNLSVVPNNARIFFRYNGKKNAPAQTYWYIDNVVVSNDLQAPTDLTVTDVTASTADLSWTMNGHGNAQIMYSMQSDFSDPQYSTTGSLTELEGYTTYYAKVRARARRDATSMWFYSSWSDPVEFTTLCSIPTNLYLYSDPVQGVTASWDGNASVYNLKYESMESVFNNYNGMVCVDGNSYTFTGSETVPLVQGMKYRFSVQAQCEPTMASDWSDWVVFADCPTYLSLPLHQNFDYIPVSDTNTEINLPGCWMYVNNFTVPEYQSYPRIENNESLCYSNYYPEDQYNYIRFNMPVNGTNQSLIFPAIDPVSANGVTLSFWVRSVSSETVTNFVVGLMDQTLNINSVYIKQYVNSHSTNYEQMSFTFTYEELVQHGSYIVIKAPATSTYPVSFCIDNIDIYPADYHCDEPVNVHAENINMNSAVIVWQNPESGGGEWGFKYKKETDVEWTVVYETGLLSNYYEFDYLDLGTTYNVAVINNCNDIDHSEWVEYSFTTPGYTPVPTNVAVDTYYGSSWVELTWECLPVTGQNPVESYEIQLDSNPIEPCSGLYYRFNVIEKGQHTFRVRAIDDQGNTGDWSETLSFVIEGCNDPVDIDSEHSAFYNFNALHLPDCWTVTGRPDKFDLGSSLMLMVDENYETYAELPQFNIADSDFDGLKVSFEWQQLSSELGNGTVAGVQVQYSDNGTQWSDAGDFISLFGDVEYVQDVNCSRNIPAPYPTVYVRLKFVVEDYNDFGEYPPQCILDNLHVIGQSLCGDIPTNLHVVDGYPANQQVVLSWTAGNDEQTEWQLAISKDSNSNWHITSPFTSEDCTMGFNVDHNSTYHVKVR